MDNKPRRILDILVTILAGLSFITLIIGWINGDLMLMIASLPFLTVGLNKVVDYFYYYAGQ